MPRSQETFTKKEREKKQQKKKQDKLDKMRERKENKEKGKSLDDMMAYLDENGNLTSKPPDPKRMRTFSQEEIQIGVPKQVAADPAERRTGVVTFFNDHKGFGFINDTVSHQRIFVHVNELTIPIQENDKVTFIIGTSHKGPIALQVELVKK
jgi:cold shock CspA family protein